MLSRTPTMRALLRASTSHTTSTSARTQFTRSFSRLQYRAHTPPIVRPSLSLTYRALPIHLQTSVPTTLHTTTSRSNSTTPTSTPAPSAAQWTHFNTAYSYSSVRTFTSSRASRMAVAAPESSRQAPSAEAAQKIEEAIERITDLYGTARDEFEIATEETEKNSTYAPADREAAREELDTLLEYYTGIIEGEDRVVAEEVRRRVGGRVRELEQAVLAMEEAALHEH